MDLQRYPVVLRNFLLKFACNGVWRGLFSWVFGGFLSVYVSLTENPGITKATERATRVLQG